MGKLLKIVLSIFSLLVLLILITAMVLPFVIDPNDYKPEIIAIVKDKTGRTLDIDGDFQLSLFPWLGVSTGKLALSNTPGYAAKHIAKIDEGHIKVKLLPLFSKKIEVSRIVLKGLTVNLEKNTQGIGNWNDSNATNVKQSAFPIPALAAFAVGGISIDGAQIVWDDRQANKYVAFKELNVNTERLEFDRPVAVELAFTAVTEQPQVTEQISFSSQLIVDKSLDNIDLNNIVLDSKATGELFPGGQLPVRLQADAALDLGRKKMKVTGLQLSSGDLTINAELSGENLATAPHFHGPVNIIQFSPRKLMQQWQIDVPTTRNEQTLTRLAAQFNVDTTADSIHFMDTVINFDDTRIQGAADIKNLSQPVIHFDLTADRIDVDHYLPPPIKKVTDNGKSSRSLGTPATAVAAGINLIPVDSLRALNANGTLVIEQATISNLHLQAIKLKLSAKDGIVDSRQSVQKLYHGNYSGNINMNVKHHLPEFSLREEIANVQVEPLLNDLYGKSKMKGTVNASAILRAKGHNVAEIKSSLNGELDFKFNNGIIKGFNLLKIINETKAIFNKRKVAGTPGNNETEYSEISMDAKVNNGLISTDNLLAKSSYLRINGTGTMDMVTEKLDYQLTAKLIKKQATVTEPEKIEGVPVVIDLTGTLDEPVFTPNVKKTIPEQKKQQLIDKLDKKLGKDASRFLKQFF